MADAKRLMLATLMMEGNEIKQFAVDNVEELPQDLQVEGRLVFNTDTGRLYIFHDGSWVAVADEALLKDTYQPIDEKDQVGGYVGIDSFGKMDVDFIPTGNKADKIPMLKGIIADGQSVRYSEESGGFVAFDVSNIYEFKGTVTSAELDLITGQKNGDAYNVSDKRSWQGHTYDKNTTWAWEGTEWEPLAGMVDLTPYQRVDAMVQTILESDAKGYPSAKAVADFVAKYHNDNRTTLIDDWSDASDDNAPSSVLVRDSLAEKTDILKAIPEWSETKTYLINSTVVCDEEIFISVKNDNIGHYPTSDLNSEWWVSARGTKGNIEGKVRCYLSYMGNGRDKDIVVNHNFGTMNLYHMVRTNTVPSRFVLVNAEATTDKKMTFRFTEPPQQNEFVTMIMAISSETGGSIVQYVQTDPSAEWVINHNMSSAMLVQVFGLDGDQMFADIQQSPDRNTVTLSFGSPVSGYAILATAVEQPGEPTTLLKGAGKGRVVNIAGAPSVALENASGTWVLKHDRARMVMIQVYDLTGDQVFVDVQQDPNTLDTITVNFTSKLSGTIVIV